MAGEGLAGVEVVGEAVPGFWHAPHGPDTAARACANAVVVALATAVATAVALALAVPPAKNRESV
jgi:hypothetical protein